MESAHARIANELSAGSLKAIQNFEAGLSDVENPFKKQGEYWAWTAYSQKMRRLVCARDHGTEKCCQIHWQHLEWQTTISFLGYVSCPACETEVDKLRETRKAKREARKNESATG